MAMQTRSQRLAKTIYKQIREVEKKGADYGKKYGALCHKLPAFILSNGLMQAVAFLESKGKEHHKEFISHIKEVLCPNASSLHEHIMSLDCTGYMQATRLALEASVWYVRFAESILKVKKGEEAGEE